MSKATEKAAADARAKAAAQVAASQAAKQAETTAQRRAAVVDDSAPKTRARIVTDLPDGPQGEEHVPARKEVMVTANVPKGFRLTLDDGTQLAYSIGAQLMPQSHAEHWYAQANGVTIPD